MASAPKLGLPPKRKTAKRDAPVIPPDDDEPPSIGDLPGSNPYDHAVSTGAIDYATAKTREDVAYGVERIIQAKLASDASRISLAQAQLAYAKERDQVIDRSDYLARQEAIVGSFIELLRLVVTDLGVFVPTGVRESAIESTSLKAHSALTALAEAVTNRQAREVVTQAMHDAFRGDE